jgi:NADPH:quinone reductase
LAEAHDHSEEKPVMPIQATAACIHQYGAPEVLQFEDISVADPVGNEVRIRNKVIGLNFVDVYYRRGSMPVPEFPAIIGNEGAGVIEAVGPNVTSVKVGDRVVYGHPSYGAYASVRICDADHVVVIPDGISDEQAASSFLKGLTSRYLVKEIVALTPGDTVLYHAAAGGVGLMFAQWAKSIGVRLIGTVSDSKKAEAAKAAGFDEIINYRTEDFVARTLALTNGAGVKAVFDSVGKDTLEGSLATLKNRGTLAQFGIASGESRPIHLLELAPRSLMVTWPSLPSFIGARAELLAAAKDLFNAIQTGILDVTPTRVYSFEEVTTAHHDLESRRTVGSAVLRI